MADVPKNTARRDLLLEIQASAQKKWNDSKVFEVDAPAGVQSNTDNKFYGNFPYPYMNGLLHLGHAFSLSKLEFASAYNRLCGKHTLFPFAFHCTGMPIKACADKLTREMSLYGNPPVFPDPEAEAAKAEAAKAAAGPEEKADPTKFKAKKTKAVAKSGTATYQWNIMKSQGLQDGEIPEFADSRHWLDYFPPLAKRDVAAMGCGVDWRRSFITTDVNPYYDSFTRWHLTALRRAGKVVKDKRFAVFSPLDGQPCADHDRASGEGVGPQEYTLIKMEVLEFAGALAPLAGRKVYFVAATLRPETMYGQTNAWVLPDGDYGAFEMASGEVFVITERSALNLSYQDQMAETGKLVCLAELKGTDLIGTPLKAGLAVHERIYALPMMTILTNKGTGVVTSVPSDAPDDHMALLDLKNKPALREKFGVKDEWVLPFEPIPIINIPEFGDLAAPTVCAELGIKTQNDRVKLDEAKHRTYLKGFTDGVMLVGEYKGRPVQEAKPIIRDEMIAAGQAVNYAEPEKVVMSRSGDECVVALTDQWYITYGEEEWQAQAAAALAKMEMFSDDTRRAFEHTLGWLKQWACSRSFGLGTRLPWDPEYLIESLSDSTVYMAFYTVAHLLQGGDMYGGTAGRPVAPELLTQEVWDHVFLDHPLPATAIPKELLAKMKQEFNFWYPFDLRVSGKDLIQNHLTFTIYNHCAIFPEDKWPRAFRTNGHLLLNSEKMSKSTGNFKTLEEAIKEYSADVMRVGLADSGDSLEDANFVEENANANILRITKELTWAEEVLAPGAGLRAGPPTTFADRVFDNDINCAAAATQEFYDKMMYREALRTGWYELITARDIYRASCGPEGMNKGVVHKFLEVQTLLMVPITPHTCEHVWSNLLKREGSVLTAGFPETPAPDANLQMSGRYLTDQITSIRKAIIKAEAPKKAKKGAAPEKPPKVTGAHVFVAAQFTGWHATCLESLRGSWQAATRTFADDADARTLAALSKDPLAAELGEKKLKSLAMPFVKFKKAEAVEMGPHVLQERLPFSEVDVLAENKDYIMRALAIDGFTVHLNTDPEAAGAPDSAAVQAATPGAPAVALATVAAPASADTPPPAAKGGKGGGDKGGKGGGDKPAAKGGKGGGDKGGKGGGDKPAAKGDKTVLTLDAGPVGKCIRAFLKASNIAVDVVQPSQDGMIVLQDGTAGAMMSGAACVLRHLARENGSMYPRNSQCDELLDFCTGKLLPAVQRCAVDAAAINTALGGVARLLLAGGDRAPRFEGADIGSVLLAGSLAEAEQKLQAAGRRPALPSVCAQWLAQWKRSKDWAQAFTV